jgi:hypothetical protein
VKFLLLPLLLASIFFFNEIRSGGFLFPITYSTLPFDPTLETASADVQENLEKVLSQKFHFLGAGRQSYAFASGDGLYVIKFFKRVPIHFPFPLSACLSEQFMQQFNAYRTEKITAERKSYKIAYDLLKEESALLLIHLNKTPFSPGHITLVDTLGLTHKTSLENKEFVLQKKAQLFYPYIDQKMKEGDLPAAQEAIHSMVQLLLKRYTQGLLDDDPAFHRNLGIVEGKAVFIDIGRLKKKKKTMSVNYTRRKIHKTVRKFNIWLTKNHPELLPFLDQELSSLS